jgi:hypothetical protein
MLSPNATNFTADRTGTAETVTAKLHVAVCPRLSVAVQPTVVEPMGNAEPDAGAHAVVTGAAPPVGIGVWNVTCAGWPLCATASTLAGHVIVGPAGSGWTGESPHADTSTVPKTIQNDRRQV